jgi:hypothetical protein
MPIPSSKEVSIDDSFYENVLQSLSFNYGTKEKTTAILLAWQ